MTYNFEDSERPLVDGYDAKIIKAIRQNPNLNHNALKRLVVKRRLMSGRTFDNHVRRLVTHGSLLEERDGRKKIYHLIDPVNKEGATNLAEKYVQLTEQSILLFAKSFPRLKQADKTENLLLAINYVIGSIGIVSLLPCITPRPEAQKLSMDLIGRLQVCALKVFTLAWNDPDSKDIATALYTKLSGLYHHKEQAFAKKLETNFGM